MILFQFLKWQLMFNFRLWIDLWRRTRRDSLICASTYTIKAPWLLFESFHPYQSGQVWVSLFFSEHGTVFYKAASTKRYYISHIQVWTQSDGQSSLWSCWVCKASPTFSKKSVIHAVVNVFWFFFLFSFFFFFSRLIYNPCLLCSVSPAFLLTGACNLHTTKSFKYHHTMTDIG